MTGDRWPPIIRGHGHGIKTLKAETLATCLHMPSTLPIGASEASRCRNDEDGCDCCPQGRSRTRSTGLSCQVAKRKGARYERSQPTIHGLVSFIQYFTNDLQWTIFAISDPPPFSSLHAAQSTHIDVAFGYPKSGPVTPTCPLNSGSTCGEAHVM